MTCKTVWYVHVQYTRRLNRTHTTTDALTWRKASQGGEGGCPGGVVAGDFCRTTLPPPYNHSIVYSL